MAQELSLLSASEITSVDDFYLSALFDDEESPFPISDSKYAEGLQLQEALMSSSTQTTTSSSSSSAFLSPSSPQPPMLIQLLPPNDNDDDILEAGESSRIVCEICTDRKPINEIFKNDNNFDCKHSFCTDCISKYISTKVLQNAATTNVVSCPGLDCKDLHALELDDCREILPRAVVEKWDELLCEALILASQKFYCPYKDCSALLVDDSDELGEVIVESECPICHRLFCARCCVPWHSGIGCEEFERLNEDERGREDLMVRELANQNKWKRCPKCMYYVEKAEGCLHMTCRCAFEFCYGCGSEWTETHGGCQ